MPLFLDLFFLFTIDTFIHHSFIHSLRPISISHSSYLASPFSQSAGATPLQCSLSGPKDSRQAAQRQWLGGGGWAGRLCYCLTGNIIIGSTISLNKTRLSDFFPQVRLTSLVISVVHSLKDVVFKDGDINRFWSILIHQKKQRGFILW